MSAMGGEQDATRGEVIVYEAPDGAIRVDVRLERETVWLTQQQMAELFGRERSVVAHRLDGASRPRDRARRAAVERAGTLHLHESALSRRAK